MSRHRRRHLAVVTAGAAVAVGVVVPLALAVLTGSIGIPHNDSWSHSVIAQTFARETEIELVGWNRSFLIGQIVALGPLAETIVVQHAFVAVLALAGLLSTFILLADRVSFERAAFGTLVVAVFPGFGLLATSYMTDIPAFAGVMTCLLLGSKALQRGSVPLLGAAVAIGMWSTTVREQSLAAVAVLVAAAARWRDRGKRRGAMALAGAALALLGALELWRRGLPHDDAPGLSANLRSGVLEAVPAYCTLAFAVSPAVLFGVRNLRWTPARVAVTAAAGVLVVAWSLRLGLDALLLENYLEREGAYPTAAVGTRDVLPPLVWYPVLLLAAASAVLLPALLLASRRRLDLLLVVFGALTLVGTTVQPFVGQVMFDRYLLPLVPVLLVPLLAGPRPLRVPAFATAGLVGAVSLVLAANALAYDAARWEAAEDLVAQGIPSTDIDAGLEWVGYHSPVPANQLATPSSQPLPTGFYSRFFSGSRTCYLVSASPQHGPRLVRRAQYRRYAVFGSDALFVYRARSC